MPPAEKRFLATTGNTYFLRRAGATHPARCRPHGAGPLQGTPQRTLAVINVRAKKGTVGANWAPSAAELSAMAARISRRYHSIRQNIIGHALAIGPGRLRLQGLSPGGHGAFALLHEPARQHGGSVFLEPLVQQFGDFLAQIRGVRQPRELVGLQCVAGSGEKKFPGSRGGRPGHKDLQEREKREYEQNISGTVITRSSYYRRWRLWICVENQRGGNRCCSACAGDYEDPDRTAWEDQETDGLEQAGEGKETEKQGSNEVKE